MGASYIFFNTTEPLTKGTEIREDIMHVLGKSDDVKNLLHNIYKNMSWELSKNNKKSLWIGSNPCGSDDFADISLDIDNDGNCHYVYFAKSSNNVLKKALSVLRTNNLFIDGDTQIINDL